MPRKHKVVISNDAIPYLRTLRRLPSDIVQEIATRNLNLLNGEACVCGWALRAGIARQRKTDAAEVETELSVCNGLEDMFGGTWREWDRIFVGVTESDTMPIIEEAFVARLAETMGAEVVREPLEPAPAN